MGRAMCQGASGQVAGSGMGGEPTVVGRTHAVGLLQPSRQPVVPPACPPTGGRPRPPPHHHHTPPVPADLLLGFEVQQASLGYLADRAAQLGLPALLPRLSRLLPRPSAGAGRGTGTAEGGEEEAAGGGGGGAAAWGPQQQGQQWQQRGGRGGGRGGVGPPGPGSNPAEQYEWNTAAGLEVGGRVVLNGWRLMKGGGWGEPVAGSARLHRLHRLSHGPSYFVPAHLDVLSVQGVRLCGLCDEPAASAHAMGHGTPCCLTCLLPPPYAHLPPHSTTTPCTPVGVPGPAPHLPTPLLLRLLLQS